MIMFGDKVYKINAKAQIEVMRSNRGFFSTSDPLDLHYTYFSGTYKLTSDEDKLDIYNKWPKYYEQNTEKCKSYPKECGMFYCSTTSERAIL